MKEDIDKDNVLDMAALAELYHANMFLCKCIEYVIEENVAIKIEDVKKYPNVFIGIMDKQKKDIEVMEEKLKEAEDVLEKKRKQVQDLENERDEDDFVVFAGPVHVLR